MKYSQYLWPTVSGERPVPVDLCYAFNPENVLASDTNADTIYVRSAIVLTWLQPGERMRVLLDVWSGVRACVCLRVCVWQIRCIAGLIRWAGGCDTTF